jgi:arylsulfatase A-like enzyme
VAGQEDQGVSASRRVASAAGSGPGWAGPLATGAGLGALAGLLEVILQLGRAGSAVHRAHLFEVVVLYGLAGLAVGGGLLLISLALLRRPPSIAFVAALVTSLFVFLIVGGFINLYFLPEAVSRISLLVTAGILLVSLILGRVLYILLRLLRWQGVRIRPRGRLGLGGLIAIAVIALAALALVSYMPAGRPARAPRGALGQGAGNGDGLNVLVLLADALRPDHLSLNGYARETSPHIDAFARAGAVFDNAGAQSSWTKPSTATILTGRYPSAHGMHLMANGVPEAIELLPEMLQRHGYRTALLTANNFVSPIFGFDRGVDFVYASNPPRFLQLMLGHLLSRVCEWSSLARQVMAWMDGIERALVGGGTPAGGLKAGGLTQAFLQWLDADRQSGRPFFAYLHFMEPHAPYAPPPPYDTFFMSPRLAAMPHVTNFPAYAGFLPFEKGRAVSPDSLQNMIALYDGAIRSLDESLGRLFGEFSARGLDKNTLIIFTADHGEEFYDRGGWGHGQSLYEELIHVPLILSCPRSLGPIAGSRFVHSVRHVDLVPTILELCGLPGPLRTDGRSLLPILHGEEPAGPPRPVFSEVNHGGRFANALRIGTEKVMFCQRATDRQLFLFDLAADPGERQNLAGTAPAQAARAEAQLQEFQQSVAREAPAEVRITIDDATRERLRALGYVR